MRSRSKSARTTGKAKPMVKGASRASTSRKSGGRSGSSPKAAATGKPASLLIDQRIRDLAGWRGETLARMRALILQADPAMTEEWKWDGPVWSHDGIVCTGEAYTKVVKLTFAQGASIPDPSRLFNSSLGGNTRRAIDIHEGESVDADAFRALVKAAVARNGLAEKNTSGAGKPRESSTRSKSPPKAGGKAPVALLSGGNPQIAKAEGDAPVQAYISAMPGWKRDLGKRLDALIVRHVPNVRKAVKWNSPFYGIEGRGWFLSFHVFTRYVKVTFFRGTSLRPVPPVASKHDDVRHVDIHEDDDLDEAQMAIWVQQAAALPGWDGRPS